jgi:hypothetical protein
MFLLPPNCYSYARWGHDEARLNEYADDFADTCGREEKGTNKTKNHIAPTAITNSREHRKKLLRKLDATWVTF